MMRSITFVTIASDKIGMGHLVRTLAMANMLNDNFRIQFLVETDSSKILDIPRSQSFIANKISNVNDINEVLPLLKDTEIIVLDFHTLTSEYQKAIKEENKKLVCIDDLHQVHFYADLIFNVSAGVDANSYSTVDDTCLCLGPDYVLFRPEFIRASKCKARTIEHIDSIFINMGGSDMPNNTLKFLNALVKITAIKNVHLVIGIANPHKAELLNYINSYKQTNIQIYSNIDSAEIIRLVNCSQLAICPASGISMELCAVGVGIISGHTADNQLNLLAGLVDKGCIFNFGDFNALSSAEITKMVEKTLCEVDGLNQMILQQKEFVDGNSAERINQLFKALS